MTTKKASPYVPAFLKAAIEGNRPLQLTFSDVKDTNILSTSSFMYDASDAPLKSTQQLNVDWSKFQNHTFFMSAESKVNLAFDQIINGFPFDGTRAEAESFFEKLSGFEKWVFDSFPKYHGQLAFIGSSTSDTTPLSGSYIVVKDSAGGLYPELSKTKTGASILNPPQDASLSIEMHLMIPSISNDRQIICQKKNDESNHGFSLYLEPSLSTSSVEARFSVFSGSSYLTVPCNLQKGIFNQVCAVLNKESGAHYLEFFKNSESAATTKSKYTFGEFDIDASDFLIGSGTSFSAASTVSPLQTFSGSIDEFKVFHSARTPSQQAKSLAKSIFASPDLKLYYRFNEPGPPLAYTDSDATNAVVIDSSGNSLHASISNYFSYVYTNALGEVTASMLRENASLDPKSKMIFEKEETVPVLFPAYPDVVSLNQELITSASAYDAANPNLVSKLIPPHYLQEGALFDGLTELGSSETPDAYGGTGLPGEGKLSNVQVMLSMLYIWAQFFDEMKLFVDSFSALRTVDYDQNTSTPNNFLRDLFRQYGFHTPTLFSDSTVEQYVNAENIESDNSSSARPLRSVQDELLRRIIINLPGVIKSKGTQHSIQAFLRSVGIDPDNSLRLREFGGPTTRQLSFARESKREVSTMVEFISSSLVISPFLSASRIEPGFPAISGTFVFSEQHPLGISNSKNDGLLTSGSWTVETTVKFNPYHIRAMTSATQSLARMCVVGTMNGGIGLTANLIAISSSSEPRISLYVRANNEAGVAPLALSLPIPDNAIFDSEKWYVSFGRQRNDEINSFSSSSYFLRIANQNNGEIQYANSTSSFYREWNDSSGGRASAFSTLLPAQNASGTFLAIGQNQTLSFGSGGGDMYLNNTLYVPDEARALDFSGMQSDFRFWSKALSDKEWREHVTNHNSLGVQEPLVNYNFVNTRSGSFERVRIDSFKKQHERRAIATASLGPLGSLSFLDYSLNVMHLTGSGFPIDRDSLRGEIFDVGYISPYFDEAATNEKVRIRSFLEQDNIDQTPWASRAPVYEIVKSEEPTDDVRFAIEFSLIDALNRDIITMFSTLDAIENAIGAPELMFSPDYPDLEAMRNVYFNRISEKLNFKGFFDFFKWFDTSIGTFIEQLIPKKTNFKGTNFVIESHMLERHKLQYLTSEAYITDGSKSRLRDVLLTQQAAGVIRKY